MAEQESTTDISREFMWGALSGEDPFCPRPWRTLKVTLKGTTRICCDFFTQLPEFDWPSAQDFHAPDRMWNHPFMQHLRSTMGMPDEVSFCTLCLTKDKRSPEHVELRRQTMEESRAVYRRIEDESFAMHYRGTIGARGPIGEVVLRLPNGREIQPFPQELAYYRRMVRMRHFHRRGHVLQLGVSTPAIAPFLAEANDHLTILGSERPADQVRIDRAAEVCRIFDLDPTAAAADLGAVLPYADDTFDAIWVDGPTLHESDRGHLFAEAARVVRPGGTVLVHVAPGPGALLRRAARATGAELDAILAVLDTGPSHDGPLNIVTVAEVRRTVKRCGMKLDIASPLGQQWLPPGVPGPVATAAVAAEIDRLAASYVVEQRPGGPLGIEGSVTFAAMPDPAKAEEVEPAGAGRVLLGMPGRGPVPNVE